MAHAREGVRGLRQLRVTSEAVPEPVPLRASSLAEQAKVLRASDFGAFGGFN